MDADRAYEVLTASRYAQRVADRLHDVLADQLRAVYLVGSLAMDDFRPGYSDIDMLAISHMPLKPAQKRAVVRAVETLDCPARGLEFVLYDRPPEFEINLNTGPRMPRQVSFDPASEPAHWFVLDVAIAREHAVPLAGPPAREVLPPMPEERIDAALHASLDWHAEHEPGSRNAVLNACRAWRYAEERVWCSKSGAAAWAADRLAG